jgi:hypothetical protein
VTLSTGGSAAPLQERLDLQAQAEEEYQRERAMVDEVVARIQQVCARALNVAYLVTCSHRAPRPGQFEEIWALQARLRLLANSLFLCACMRGSAAAQSDRTVPLQEDAMEAAMRKAKQVIMHRGLRYDTARAGRQCRARGKPGRAT